MRHLHWLVHRLALIVVVVLAGPLSAYAASAGPTGQEAEQATAAALLDTMVGSIDMQRGALNGRVALGRGSVALNAKLTDAGPDGQLNLSVPGQFLLDLTAAQGELESVLCGVVGPQEIRASGGLGSGLRLEFLNAESNPTPCSATGTAHEMLTMGPNIIGAQAAPASEGTTVPGGVLDGLRRLVIIGLISGLLFVFAPGLSAPVTAAARTRPWSRLGLGVCLLITVPITGILIFALGFAVGLWWIGLLVLMFFACLLAFSYAVAGLILGAWLLARVQVSRVPLIVGLAAGLVLLTVLGFLPSVGALVNVVALAYGAGALMLLPRTRVPQGVLAVAAPSIPPVVAPTQSAVVPPTPSTVVAGASMLEAVTIEPDGEAQPAVEEASDAELTGPRAPA